MMFSIRFDAMDMNNILIILNIISYIVTIISTCTIIIKNIKDIKK